MALLSRSLQVNIIANYLGQGWSAAMAIAFLPLYAAELGLEAFGLVGLFALLQSALFFFDFGITTTLTREAARYRGATKDAQSLRDLFRSSQIVAAGLTTILLFGVWGGADYVVREWINLQVLERDSAELSIVLMGLVIAMRLQEGVYRGVLVGLGEQVRANIVHAAIATVRYPGAAIVFWVVSPDVVYFFVWQVTSSLFSLLAFVYMAGKALPIASQPPRFSGNAIGSVWPMAAGLATVTGLSTLMANLDRIMLSGMVPLDDFGRYTLAAAVASGLYLLVVPISQGLYPDMVGAHSRHRYRAVARMHHFGSQLTMVTAGSLGALLIVFSPQVIFAWSGDRHLASEISPIMGCLAGVALANSVGHLGHNLQLVKGATVSLAITIGCAVLVSIYALPRSYADGSLDGVARVWLAVAVLQACVILVLAHRGPLKSEAPNWLFFDIILPLLGSVGTGWVLSSLVPLDKWGRLATAGYLVVSATLMFLIATLLASNLRRRVKIFLKCS